MNKYMLKSLSEAHVLACANSAAWNALQFFVGTKKSQMYMFSYTQFEASRSASAKTKPVGISPVRVKTCHYSPVNDVIFPS